MAEQFALEQLLGDGRAVEGDEGLVGAGTEVVQAAGDQFLAAAGLAAQEHVDRCRRQVEDLLAQADDARRDTEQAAGEGALVVDPAVQLAVLQHQPALFQGAAEIAEQRLGAEGLFQEVVGALAHGADRQGDVAVGGEQNNRQVGIQRLQPFQQGQAVHAGHAHVADHHPGEIRGHRRQAVFGAGEQPHLMPRQLQPLAYRFADAGFVVDQIDLSLHGRRPLAAGAPLPCPKAGDGSSP